LARGFTRRDKIIKFDGCYHGHADSLLVKAGSGALTLGCPDSAGVPADLARHTLVLPFNDADAVAFWSRDTQQRGAAPPGLRLIQDANASPGACNAAVQGSGAVPPAPSSPPSAAARALSRVVAWLAVALWACAAV
jgi:hypothetical protein